jgi:magnesium transporter
LENLTLEDIVNTESRPKFEEFENYIFIILKDLHCPEEGDFGMEQISMVIKDNMLITFQEEPGDVFDGVRGRIKAGTSKIRIRGIDYLAYALMDAIIDNYIVVTETFDHYLDGLEDLLYATTHRRQLIKIKDAKKHYNTLKRVVHPMKDVVYNMYRTEHRLITKRTHIYTRDLYDHVTSIDDTIIQSRDKVYGLMGIYQSGTNNIMNSIMKTLTIVSAIFMALSLIAGIYGMNFDPEKSPYNMPELHWLYGYPFALGLMAITAIGLIIYFRFRKWL